MTGDEFWNGARYGREQMKKEMVTEAKEVIKDSNKIKGEGRMSKCKDCGCMNCKSTSQEIEPGSI